MSHAQHFVCRHLVGSNRSHFPISLHAFTSIALIRSAVALLKQSGKAKGAKAKAVSQEVSELLALAAYNAVWSGSIARLRIYASDGTVIAYKAPGHDADVVGDTDDPNMIKALFLSRDNGRPIMGYTDGSGRIAWLDY